MNPHERKGASPLQTGAVKFVKVPKFTVARLCQWCVKLHIRAQNQMGVSVWKNTSLPSTGVHTQWNLDLCKTCFFLGFYVVYRLLRRAERHHCVFSMLPARQQLWKLQLCHGKPFPVRRHETACTICKYCARVWLFCPWFTQVRHKHAGAPGGRRLYDCVPEWRHTPQETSWIYMDQKVLSNDW